MSPQPAVSAVAPPSGVPDLRARVGPVLAGLPFPARRWQVVTQAELYGCDGVTRTLLERLPDRSYLSFAELLAVLAAVSVGRAAPASPAVAGAPRPAPRTPAPTRTAVVPRSPAHGTHREPSSSTSPAA